MQLQSAECQAPPLEALDNRACTKRRVRSSTRLKHSEVTACRVGVKRARIVIVPIRFLWMPSGLTMIHVLSDAVPFLHIQFNAANEGREAAHPDGSWTLSPPHGMPRLIRPGWSRSSQHRSPFPPQALTLLTTSARLVTLSLATSAHLKPPNLTCIHPVKTRSDPASDSQPSFFRGAPSSRVSE